MNRRGASVSFYQEYDWSDAESSGRKTASLTELPCGLLSVDVTLNGRTLNPLHPRTQKLKRKPTCLDPKPAKPR